MACNKICSGRKAIKLIFLALSILLVSACAPQHRQAESVAPLETDPSAKKEITIALLGSTGMVGGFILKEALSRGYNIRALARTPYKLDAFKQRITVVEGDARDSSSIDALLQGSHIIISALGPVKADGDAASMLSTTVTANIIQLMPKHNIERYIVVSGAAVEAPGDDRNMTGWLLRQMASIAFNKILKDKQSEYQLLAESNIEWTLVRCPLINSELFEHAATPSLETPTSFALRASELARFIVDQITANDFSRKAPFLSSH